MNETTGLVLIVFTISLATVIHKLVDRLWPAQPMDMSEVEALDNELGRLHNEIGHYDSAPSWASNEIARINEKLAEANKIVAESVAKEIFDGQQG